MTLKQFFAALAYLLLAMFMALLSFTSFINLSKQWHEPDFYSNSTNLTFMVFLLGTSLAGLIYLLLALYGHKLAKKNFNWLNIIALIVLLPCLLWFSWMFLFHLGL